MDADLKRRVDALRRPLELAAADNFAGVRKIAGLGHVLRIACDAVLAKHPVDGLAAWRTAIDRWEQLDETQQAVEVARGMRLLARIPRPAGAALERARAAAAAVPAPPANARPIERTTARSVPVPARPTPGGGDTRGGGGAAAASNARGAVGAAAASNADDGAAASNVHGVRGTEASNAGGVSGGARGAAAPNALGASGGARGAAVPNARGAVGAAAASNARGAVGAAAASSANDGPAASNARGVRDAEASNAFGVSGGARGAAASNTRGTEASNAGGAGGAAASNAGGVSGAARGAAASKGTEGSNAGGAGGAAASNAGSAAASNAGGAGGAANAGSAAASSARGAAGAAAASNARGAVGGAAASSAGGAAASRARGAGGAAVVAAAGDPLAAPTDSLPGIGPAFAERLAERGLLTVEDLLWTLPRRYDDVRDARTLADACAADEGQRVTFGARVASARMVFARGRRWAEVRLGSIDLTDRAASCVVRWFNVYAGIEKRMPAGSQVVLSGVVRRRNGRTEFANPDILGIEVPDAGPAKPRALASILPRYPDIAGVPGSRLRQACATACERVAAIADDGVPAHVEQAAGMPSLPETLARLHSPPPDIPAEDLAAMNRGDSRWQRRLAFGELFSLGIAVALRRQARRADRAVGCPNSDEIAAAIAAALPFAPTGAQRRAIGEIGDDLAREVPMNRLLQGDVGAGKTAVAFAAAVQVARAGRQTAVMAPTELLAEQHAETWRRWSERAGLRIELLTASTPKGVRASLLALLAAGQLDVVIGTHALLSEGVGFGALGLVVIDEQHRFGVAQRAKLRDKGDGQGSPHLLVMTATPIPRTLALTAYGDLDVSVLDELPPGRQPITTKLVTGARGRAAASKLIVERVAAGERAYVVCPKVEPGEDDGEGAKWKDAVTVADELARELRGIRVGLVHGRLDAGQRDRVMRAFKAGELDVLVATTVIEVGVDVPEATVMVIHDADRFGLAQLHQLRGRVGRGGAAAHCLLLVQGGTSDDGEQRLATMVATTDGFRIAEEDLLLRGAGDLLGARQAGVPRLAYGDLHQHTELLLEARRQAEAVLDGDPDLLRPENAALRRALDRRIAHEVYGAESG